MSVVEAICRLTSPDDVFLDVGANIGFMSSVALAQGAKSVFAFKPNPLIFPITAAETPLYGRKHILELQLA